jgi:hypothetical protein
MNSQASIEEKPGSEVGSLEFEERIFAANLKPQITNLKRHLSVTL